MGELDEEKVSYMLRKLKEECDKAASMQINFKKTEDPDIKKLEIEEDLETKGCENFKYFGFTISKTVNNEDDIRSLLG